jgi:hypothetical protein
MQQQLSEKPAAAGTADVVFSSANAQFGFFDNA